MGRQSFSTDAPSDASRKLAPGKFALGKLECTGRMEGSEGLQGPVGPPGLIGMKGDRGNPGLPAAPAQKGEPGLPGESYHKNHDFMTCFSHETYSFAQQRTHFVMI